MSWNPTQNPDCPDRKGLESIETLIIPRAATWAASRCAARFPRRAGRWSAPSSSSTRWARPNS